MYASPFAQLPVRDIVVSSAGLSSPTSGSRCACRVFLIACLSHASLSIVCGRQDVLGCWGWRREASKAKPKHVRFVDKPTSNEAEPVRRSGRRLYLGGQEAVKAPGRDQIGKPGEERVKMSTARTASSEATNTNDEDIASGMMHLAIACTHISRQSNRFGRPAGKKITPLLNSWV